MPKILFNGEPGTVWVNNTPKVRYQFFCDWTFTCGVCAQYDHAIGAIWPIPLHRRCRCFQRPILVGAEADPFIDYREKILSLDQVSQTKVMGRSAFDLWTKGVIKYEDAVSSTHVRTLQEIVARENLTIDDMLKAGVRRDRAQRAYSAVHTPVQEILKAHRAELVAKLEGAGLSRADVIDVAAKKVAERVTIQGPSGTQAVTVTGGNLGALLQQIAARNAVLYGPQIAAAPPPQPPLPKPAVKPYDLEVIGDIPPDRVAEFEKWIGELPPEVLEKIKANNAKFVYTKRLEELDSALAAERPQGWPADSSWKNVDGLYDPKTKRVIVAHERQDYFTKEYGIGDRQKGVLFHETGHGLDDAAKVASQAKRFVDAYAADVKALAPDQKKGLSYFLQPDKAGPRETFAEVFANVLGEDSRNGRPIDKAFPEFTKTMRDLLNALKKGPN